MDLHLYRIYEAICCFDAGIVAGVAFFCGIFILAMKREYYFHKLFAIACLITGLTFVCSVVEVLVGSKVYNAPTNKLCEIFQVFYSFSIGLWGMVFSCLIAPEATSKWRQIIPLLPFFAVGIIYSICPTTQMLVISYALIIAFLISFFIQLYMRNAKRTKTLQANLSNTEGYDNKWVSNSLIIVLVLAILYIFNGWYKISVNENTTLWVATLCDIVYNDTWAILLGILTKGVIHQKPVYLVKKALEEIPIEGPECTTKECYYKNNIPENIDEIIRNKGYYLNEDLKLTDLATMIGTNRQYLSQFINQERNMSFYDYINTFRLEKAKILLGDKNNTMTNEEISTAAGFKSYACFTRVFTKVYNETPAKYRKRNNV
ncbi:MAG: helix-turn-helix transcriptional regulator [Bacteroidales bacterium]|nr:helix-turn-helix transcriptional regulator [Bacteroidales bacterium]